MQQVVRLCLQLEIWSFEWLPGGKKVKVGSRDTLYGRASTVILYPAKNVAGGIVVQQLHRYCPPWYIIESCWTLAECAAVEGWQFQMWLWFIPSLSDKTQRSVATQLFFTFINISVVESSSFSCQPFLPHFTIWVQLHNLLYYTNMNSY